MWHWQSEVPAWFQEGLAVYASDGGGAEGVSRKQAQQVIIAGNAFTPVTTGSLLIRKTAHYYGLKPHMFYKQAGIFVTLLHAQGGEQFKALIHTIQAGTPLKKAMEKVYGAGVLREWNAFVSELKRRNGTEHRAQLVS